MPNPEDIGISLWQWFGRTTRANESKYNLVRREADNWQQTNKKAAESGVVLSGMKAMITNRYNGMITMPCLYAKAKDGWLWSKYLMFNPELSADVSYAGVKWAKSIALAPSIEGLRTVTATISASSEDYAALGDAARNSVVRKGKELAFGVVAGGMISQGLKYSAQKVSSDVARMALKTTRYGFKATGALALVYGFAQIADTVNQRGVFNTELLERRDVFLETKGHSSVSEPVAMSRAVDEGFQNPFVGE